MPKAESTPTTSRRLLLTTLSASMALPAFAGQADAHPDQVLLDLADRVVGLEREMEALSSYRSFEESKARQYQVDGLHDRQAEAAEQAMPIVPVTMGGFVAKARIAACYWHPDEDRLDDCLTDQVRSTVIRDLIRLWP